MQDVQGYVSTQHISENASTAEPLGEPPVHAVDAAPDTATLPAREPPEAIVRIAEKYRRDLIPALDPETVVAHLRQDPDAEELFACISTYSPEVLTDESEATTIQLRNLLHVSLMVREADEVATAGLTSTFTPAEYQAYMDRTKGFVDDVRQKLIELTVDHSQPEGFPEDLPKGIYFAYTRLSWRVYFDREGFLRAPKTVIPDSTEELRSGDVLVMDDGYRLRITGEREGVLRAHDGACARIRFDNDEWAALINGRNRLERGDCVTLVPGIET